MLTSRGLGTVLGDLASMGFDARWGVLGAADVGANHQRDRVWIVARQRKRFSHAQHDRIGRWEQQQESVEETCGNMANTSKQRLQREQREKFKRIGDGFANKSKTLAYTSEIRSCSKETKQGMERRLGFAECGVDRNWWQREPEFVPRTTQRNMGGVADGVASRVDRLKAIGNGQVPLCAATAWRILSA